MTNIGVISFQGDFQRHIALFEQLGAAVTPVRRPEHVGSVSGLVLPGGESTTIGMLMERFGLIEAICSERARRPLPLFGTCAGAILMARRIRGSDQVRLGVMDIEVERNAYGRQIESFEASVSSHELGDDPLAGVFIRAPKITSTGDDVRVLAEFENVPVLVRQGDDVALSFHPELTGDTRVHRYFCSIAASAATSYA